ncbi:GNAT family N-acetyltransferase [Actinotalea ferrariae]|uniref:GNAT family N-acetyltransferase n=1 Tax=Actinotalea ferrariae TaxID=1386098 RepID=UPI001C8C8987|nr:GNAT family N-acetyltransferase [Actinotalea ferrariae]MBX9245550.1 GNAT family N-acetyltransferase [Actinotalea ferrariae]
MRPVSSSGAPGLRVEVATWRPVEVTEVDGWLVGRSAGFTRRANSVAALAEPADPERALDDVEALYREYGLPPVFRVCAGSAPADLDARLARRGYAVAAPTQVMARGALGELASPELPDRAAVDVADDPDGPWVAGWVGVKSRAAGHGVDVDLAARILTGAPARYLSARTADGTLLGVVRAAPAGDWVGISCLMVPVAGRRRGTARALTLAAVRDATARGARRAFLQVESSNAGAIALYAGLGFEVVDRYHYRERVAPGT